MTTFRESGLRFDFGAEWTHLRKYDEHRDYREKLEPIGSAAVDFIGQREGELYLVEVKDFRSVPLAPSRVSQLVIEVAGKARDTVGAIVGLARTSGRDADCWRTSRDALRTRRVHVVLWFEEDWSVPTFGSRKKARAGVLANSLKQKLSWFTPSVRMANIRAPGVLPGVRVRSVRGVGGRIVPKANRGAP
jgi:hypothetical protein